MEENWKIPRTPAPPGMYDRVRRRIVEERGRAAKTRRQLAAASVLLLVVGAANLTAALAFRAETRHAPATARILHEAYFNSQTPF